MKYQSDFIVDYEKYPIFDEVDVLVAGGGPAGISAAETSGRLGKKTTLLEKYGFLGGAAVAGLSGTICGLYYASEKNDHPKMLVGGFAQRFVQKMQENNGVTAPQKYGKTYLLTHDPVVFKKVSEDMLCEANVNILYHVRVIGVYKKEDELKGLVIDTKSGISIIKAKRIIDATGDADIVFRSGYQTYNGNNGSIQNPTMMFRMNNVNVNKFLQYWGDNTISPQKVIDLMTFVNKTGEFDLPRTKVWLFPTTHKDQVLMNTTRIVGKDRRELVVLDPIDHSEAEIMGRRQIEIYARFYKKYVPGFEDAYINDSGIEVGVRQTRSIVGVEQLKNNDVIQGKKFEDGIAKSAWPIELHKGQVPQTKWLLDDYYEIPYGALIPIVGENLIVAGRNLYAEHEALASSRVLAQCFGYGHAAGIACCMSIDQNIPLRKLCGVKVRVVINSDGGKLDEI
jgi:ribulose 1,5-bisphosphate synthetase/thiazole synthase